MDSTHILVTGGAGFIGANLVRHLRQVRPTWRITVVDKLNYAGNRRYICDLINDVDLRLIVADIADPLAMQHLFQRNTFDGIFHLAAESHVDRSISGPEAFLMSNVVGSFTLLECARNQWSRDNLQGRFLHVSTDEVYGSIAGDQAFCESTPYDPSSPYSATKASSDHLVQAYHRTYGLDTVITNCSNNFGPFQFPEKLIPLVIRCLRDHKPVPIYGDGSNVRDWLYVEDHCRALLQVFENGSSGRRYNIGAENEWTNLALVQHICDRVDAHLGNPPGSSRRSIQFVPDRPGHDQRYAIDPQRIRRELGWRPTLDFQTALDRTVGWYLQNLTPIWGV